MKNYIRFVLPLTFLLVLASCTGTRNKGESQSDYMSAQQHLVQATLWYQNSGEARALANQAYDLARIRLDKKIMEVPSDAPTAVIVDIDETVLNNSKYTVYNIRTGKPYDKEDWMAWTARAEADTIPGALGFLKYCEYRGVNVFYISNRRVEELEGTMANLKKFGFPFVDEEHILLRSKESSKEPRRTTVMNGYEVLLLIGDNLADFDMIFENPDADDRTRMVDDFYKEFGDKWIVLPNPAYGGWESAALRYQYDWTEKQKDSLRKAALKGYGE